MNYRSVAELNRTIIRHMPRVPRDIDLIVGIPRSGLLAANLLALYLNKPLADLDGFLAGRVLASGRTRVGHDHAVAVADCNRVLVLDDSLWTGNEIETARRRVKEAGITAEVIFSVVYCNPDCTSHVDFFFEACPFPRVFEWNLMHHAVLDASCLDIDGILCPDPSEAENDDGPRYTRFLLETPPLFVPTKRVGWLVTARLEKYRKQTEDWLRRQGIEYRELHMLDLPTKAARLAAGSHGRFKAKVYQESGATLFIESSLRQAREIASLTGKPVFCAEIGDVVTVAPPQTALRWGRHKVRRILGIARSVLGAE